VSAALQAAQLDIIIAIIIFFTLGIKDPEGFGKKIEENVSE